MSEPISKPAGCAAQGFGCAFAIIGAGLLLGGLVSLGEQNAEAGAITGLTIGGFMLLVGIIWYVRGRRPGKEAAAIRTAQAAAVAQAAAARPTKRCPFCAEEILAEARKCRHCGSELVTPSA